MTKDTNPHGLYRKAGKGTWFLPVIIRGKRTARSTGTQDLNAATKRVPELLAAAHLETTAPVPASAQWTLGQAFDAFIADKRRASAPANSLAVYETARSVLCSALGEDTKLAALTYEALGALVDARLARGLKSGPTHGLLVNLASVMRYAASRERYHGDYKKIFPKVKRGVSRKRFLSTDEIETLLAHVLPRHRDYVLAYLYTGCRNEELFSILPEHVRLDTGRIILAGTKTDGAHASLPIHPALAPILERRLASTPKGQPLFPRKSDISKRISKAAKDAGLAHLTCHDLRRTTGSLLASSGVSLQIIRDILRHSDIATTSRTYAHLLPTASATALGTLPSF